jgi:hypothetical protein
MCVWFVLVKKCDIIDGFVPAASAKNIYRRYITLIFENDQDGRCLRKLAIVAKLLNKIFASILLIANC